jgi:plastocyanin
MNYLKERDGQGAGKRRELRSRVSDHSQNCRTQRVIRPIRRVPKTTMSQPTRNALFALLFAIAIQFHFGGRAVAATTNVSFGNNLMFTPKNVTINVGDTVVWSNTGGTHTVTGDGSDPFCGNGAISTSCSHTFSTAGMFSYHCIPHQQFGMVGTVIVQASANTRPSVTITNPANGAVFAAPANVTIQANATDTDGIVTSVQLFGNPTLLVGTVTTAPYNIIASNLAAGPYALRAIATDNGGLSSTSAVVNISVVAPVSVALSPPLITNGLFQFNYTANNGLRYVVERSSNLVTWTGSVTNTASSTNVPFGEAFDVNILRFYRVGRLPNP